MPLMPQRTAGVSPGHLLLWPMTLLSWERPVQVSAKKLEETAASNKKSGCAAFGAVHVTTLEAVPSSPALHAMNMALSLLAAAVHVAGEDAVM